MSERLFVYGSLAPGRPNDHVLRDVPGTWEEAAVRGRLVEHGWGVALGFPALELSDEGDRVAGLVFTSGSLAELWHRLDEFEGEGYQRVIAPVCLPDGAHVSAHVYVARGHATR
jgi:gamma-glutamylcyclotransferase (GGCT)/AIG2-like uncharacterized protein YtfP